MDIFTMPQQPTIRKPDAGRTIAVVVLGQSAATAAVLAIDEGVPVQSVDYPRMAEQLRRDRQSESQVIEEHGKQNLLLDFRGCAGSRPRCCVFNRVLMLMPRTSQIVLAILFAGTGTARSDTHSAEPAAVCVSGIYPHLAFFNDEAECGTGAVVPWAGRLWVITYGPHSPRGSSDKLYEITRDLDMTVRPESVGGTAANRLIHRESRQLFMGRYAIDEQRRVRVVPADQMLGRLTATARHLSAPTDKVYFATMEEGLYEVDVRTIGVTELFADAHQKASSDVRQSPGSVVTRADLPGYHGKGLYSGQGLLIYANNGENSEEARRSPDVASGCLATWNARQSSWDIVRRNQFTEVTGPGGIWGNQSAGDPVWSIGWDHRSLILALLDEGDWRFYRLPKASHCYDGAHGWNTEWPRIREIGEGDLLMTMHGMFWRFPESFSAANSAGIAPRSTYLKVIGDFCRWSDRLVFGCDDAARSEFLNRRRIKGRLDAVGQSNSNLWFVEPSQLDRFGCPLGRGAVWADEPVIADVPSDPYLFSGFDYRGVHLAHGAQQPVTFYFEIDRDGNDRWLPYQQVVVEPRGYRWFAFPVGDAGAWIRVWVNRDCPSATAHFAFSDVDPRGVENGEEFRSMARRGSRQYSKGLLRVRGENRRTLALAATSVGTGQDEQAVGFYELDERLSLQRRDEPLEPKNTADAVRIPVGTATGDESSAFYIDEQGRRWRFPRGDDAFEDLGASGQIRLCREVVTERDLLNLHGTLYELPAENAGGIAKVRPIATHNLRICDYCSFRGLLVMTGVNPETTSGDDPHVVRSGDGRASLWVGAIDDLWKLGKPRGSGGPWKITPVSAGVPSDPYLMTGYDRKSLRVSHDARDPIDVRIEADISGDGDWHVLDVLSVPPDEQVQYEFARGFSAYWVRLRASHAATITGQFLYE